MIPIQFEEEDPMTYFCKTAASLRQFPFVWEGVSYSSSTMEESEFHWCALQVDMLTREVLGDRWGLCDMVTFTTMDRVTTPPPDLQKEVKAVFSNIIIIISVISIVHLLLLLLLICK